MTLYPQSIDGYSQIKVLRDRIDEVVADHHNSLRSAIIAIEQTLGINPQGAFSTVSARLIDAYNSLGSHVSGNVPRHQDDQIDADAKTGSPFSLDSGTVNSQLDDLLDIANTNSNFTGLTDTPNSYSGQSLKTIRVNSGATALEFYTSSFTELDDVPTSYSGQGSKGVRVNSGATALEFYNRTFTELTDTPNSYAGQGSKWVKVNSGASALEFSSSTFLDLNDTLNSYTGTANKIISVNSGATALEASVELPTTFLKTAFDSFVVSGMAVTQGTGVNASVATGVISSNGRLITTSSPTILTTPLFAGTYYVSAYVNSSGVVTFIGPDSNAVDVIGTSSTSAVLLAKFTHNGTTWTDSVDLRRFGSFANNKNYLSVGNDADVDDGFGADFISLKSAVEHIKVLATTGSAKMSPKKIILVDDLTISSSAEMGINLDLAGLYIDGCGRTITSSVEAVLFNIDADNVVVKDVNLVYSGLPSGTGARFTTIGFSASCKYIKIEGNTQTVSSGSVPERFIRCGNITGSTTISNCIFSNNIAVVDVSGIADARSFGNTNASKSTDLIIENNKFFQSSVSATAEACIRVGSFSVINANSIKGGYNTGIELQSAESCVVSNNIINGGTGNISGAGTPYMLNGIALRSSGSDISQRHLISGNIIKGITTTGIDARQPDGNSVADVMIVGNLIDSKYDASATTMVGIQGGGLGTFICNNKIIGAGKYGIEYATYCCNNLIEDGLDNVSFISAISVGDDGAVISGNKIVGCRSSGIDVVGKTDCLITDNVIDGSGETITHGIQSVGERCVVNSNHIISVDLGIECSAGDVSICNNLMYSCENGIECGDSEYMLISGNKIVAEGTTGFGGISAVGNRSVITNNIIRHIDADIPGQGINVSGEGILISNNSLENISITGDLGYITITGANSHGCMILNNTIGNYSNGIENIGIYISGGDYCFISGNQIFGSGSDLDYAGIYLQSGTNESIVSNNYIRLANGIGIDTTDASANVLHSNYIEFSKSYGINSTGTEVSIYGNYIEGDSRSINCSGIKAYIANNRIINDISSPAEDAILIGGISSMVVGNYIEGGLNGVKINDANLCSIVGNYIRLCDVSGIMSSGTTTDLSIVGNVINDTNNYAIFDNNESDNANINGNRLFSNGIIESGGGGIYWTGDNCIISNNDIRSNAGVGVSSAGDNCLISGNKLDGNNSALGQIIVVADSTNVSIIGNLVLNPITNANGININNTVKTLVVSNFCFADGTGKGITETYTDVSDISFQVGNLVSGGSSVTDYSDLVAGRLVENCAEVGTS